MSRILPFLRCPVHHSVQPRQRLRVPSRAPPRQEVQHSPVQGSQLEDVKCERAAPAYLRACSSTKQA